MSRKSLLIIALVVVAVTVGVVLTHREEDGASSAGLPDTSADSPGAPKIRDREGSVASDDAGKSDPTAEATAATGNPIALSGDLARVLGDDDDFGSQDRIDLLRARTGNFTNKEIDDILGFLNSGRIPEGLRPAEWYWIVDELFSRLRAESSDRKGLSQLLADLVTNSNLDTVVRDYALQHLGHLAQEGGDAGVAHATATVALAQTANPIAGTALLLLDGEASDVPVRADLGARAIAIAGDETASVDSRVTAIQVAARHDPEGALGTASAILTQDSPALLQVAAVAAVGKVGSARDLPLLEALPRGNPIVNRAVHSAIMKLVSTQS